MAITDSRNKGGSITLDGQPFSKQATSVQLTPSTDEEGDPIEVLSGDRIDADEVTTWQLELGAVQDFDDVDGFVEFCRANAGQVVPFVWEPNASGPSYAGTVRVRPVAIGGGVNVRLTTEATWAVLTGPEPTYGP